MTRKSKERPKTAGQPSCPEQDTVKVEPLRQRILRLQEAARAMGPDDPDFDMKKFMDELSGEDDF